MKVGIIGLGLMGGSFALDIKKPFPVNFFDKKFKNSFGVIMD